MEDEEKVTIIELFREVEGIFDYVSDDERDIRSVKHFLIAIQSVLIDKGIVTEDEVNEKLILLKQMDDYEQSQY